MACGNNTWWYAAFLFKLGFILSEVIYLITKKPIFTYLGGIILLIYSLTMIVYHLIGKNKDNAKLWILQGVVFMILSIIILYYKINRNKSMIFV